MPLGNFRLGNPPPNLQNPNPFGQPNWLNTGQTVLRGIQRVMPYLSQAGVQIPPAVNFLMKGIGGYPQQGIPQQGIPQQGYPSQGFFSQGFPAQTYQPSQPSPFSSQSYPPSFQSQLQPQPQALPQQVPQTPVKSGGIRALISNFLARHKG